MVKKLIYFTAGALPTVDEAAEIARLEAASAKPFNLFVRRGDGAGDDYRHGAGAEACDYVAGTPPVDVPPFSVQAAGNTVGFYESVDTLDGSGTDPITVTTIDGVFDSLVVGGG